MLVVYFSSISENTKRFVSKLPFPLARIPLYKADPELLVEEPYVLVTPTYAGGQGQGAVPKQVIRFLNNSHNRSYLRSIVATGNTNFGAAYCAAGHIIEQKTGAPLIAQVEVFGTPEDVENVTRKIGEMD